MSFQSAFLPRGILDLLRANDGHIDNRITIQKCAYLLQRKGAPDFATAEFAYHHYGPYSRDVSEALQELVATGLIDEHQASHEKYVQYSYNLTEGGKRWLAAHEVDGASSFDSLYRKLATTPWRTLELATTIWFLQQEKIARDFSSAVKQALDLKPECQQYKSDAEQLLCALNS